ncbi:hypothetical protein J6590_002440 [Homalodisca vitripennis]|nr:hypothetical protein J6590_002440 [Homalodisca vitripennis]
MEEAPDVRAVESESSQCPGALLELLGYHALHYQVQYQCQVRSDKHQLHIRIATFSSYRGYPSRLLIASGLVANLSRNSPLYLGDKIIKAVKANN